VAGAFGVFSAIGVALSAASRYDGLEIAAVTGGSMDAKELVSLRELWVPRRLLQLTGGSRGEVLAEMVRAVADAPQVRDPRELALALNDREAIMSTGIGLGVAVPHARIPSISGFVMTVGRTAEGIDWDSLDGKPVRIAVMIAGPAGEQRAYLKILATVALALRKEQIREALLNTGDLETALELFELPRG
jgi:PTS system nitrogen regulatory IIA component